MVEPKMKCAKCGTEFPKRVLRCTNCGEIGVSRLYKYFRYNDHSLSILRDKVIWFPTAASINDPFEFAFYCPEMHVNGIPIDNDSFENAIREMKQMGVLSLSEINNNILMWSHYSESHAGFCIEFERNDSNELGSWEHCAPVIYDENLPVFRPTELLVKKNVTSILITKSNLWSYEIEWRIISKQGNQTYQLPGNITGIIFGFKMSLENRRNIAAILGNKVMYKQTTKNKSKYSVDIVPISFDELKIDSTGA